MVLYEEKIKNEAAFLLMFGKCGQGGSGAVGSGQYFLMSLRWPRFLLVSVSLFGNCSQDESGISTVWGRGKRCTTWGTEKKEKYFSFSLI